MKEQVEIKNTTTIQLASLDAFCLELGYKRTVDGLRYEFIYPVKTGERFISLRSAVELHNTRWVYHKIAKLYFPPDHWGKANTDSPFKLSAYEYERSQARKIAEYVFQLHFASKVGPRRPKQQYDGDAVDSKRRCVL